MKAPESVASRAGVRHERRATDGEIWLFVLGDLLIYGLLFFLFAYAAARSPEDFSAGRALLSRPIAFVNTLLLLTSSWLVARGLCHVRTGEVAKAIRFLKAAIACGAGFVCLKVTEYALKIIDGWYLTSNEFLMYYYILTGLHLLHVLAGLVVLVFMLHLLRARRVSVGGPQTLESCAVFWHLVDLLWLLIFPLLYLIA